MSRNPSMIVTACTTALIVREPSVFDNAALKTVTSKKMNKFQVDKTMCISCSTCVSVCPQQAISMGEDGKAHIDENACQGCGECVKVCPVNAISEKQKN